MKQNKKSSRELLDSPNWTCLKSNMADADVSEEMKPSCVGPGFHLHLLIFISFYPQLPVSPFWFFLFFSLPVFLSNLPMMLCWHPHGDLFHWGVCVCRSLSLLCDLWDLLTWSGAVRGSELDSESRQAPAQTSLESSLSCLFLLRLGRCVSVLQLPSRKHTLFVWPS